MWLFVCRRVNTHACLNGCMSDCVCMYVRVYVCTCVCSYVLMCSFVHSCMHAYSLLRVMHVRVSPRVYDCARGSHTNFSSPTCVFILACTTMKWTSCIPYLPLSRCTRHWPEPPQSQHSFPLPAARNLHPPSPPPQEGGGESVSLHLPFCHHAFLPPCISISMHFCLSPFFTFLPALP